MSTNQTKDVRAESLAQRKTLIETNPCLEEQTKSLKCIEVNGSDSDLCFREIQNLKICRTFWYEIIKFRRINEIEPSLPVPEDREHMKRVFLNTGSIKPVLEDMKRQYNL